MTTEERTEVVDPVDDTTQEEQADNSGEIIARLSNRRDDLALENARLRAIIGANMDMDIDAELSHVGGLTVNKGQVEGDAAYRPPVAQKRVSSAPPPTKGQRKSGSKRVQDMSGREKVESFERLMTEVNGAKPFTI